ncbi:MAG: DNA-3-methyladenine glycosylase [Actinobacteria bacterium]|nr:DNA-3-methyladenine glycosylase [Actinomycetota bacterium]
MLILSKSFYERDTKVVAQELLGKILVNKTKNGILKGKIVETEAYYGLDDAASHASRGKTKRNSVMFGEAGIAYIYLNYGVHFLFNIVTEKSPKPGAVLIRALEPVEGIGAMMKNRKIKSIHQLTNGPGKLTKAMGIDISFNQFDLTGSDLAVEEDGSDCLIEIVKAPRIGISVAQDKLLRYYIKDNSFVSRSKSS